MYKLRGNKKESEKFNVEKNSIDFTSFLNVSTKVESFPLLLEESELMSGKFVGKILACPESQNYPVRTFETHTC